MDNVLWELFKKTGNIKYYVLAKKVGSENHENKERGGNSNK